jgi:hypothetical protein
MSALAVARSVALPPEASAIAITARVREMEIILERALFNVSSGEV